jgi:hypothetical protein
LPSAGYTLLLVTPSGQESKQTGARWRRKADQETAGGKQCFTSALSKSSSRVRASAHEIKKWETEYASETSCCDNKIGIGTGSDSRPSDARCQMKSGGSSRIFWREKNLAAWSESWPTETGHPPARPGHSAEEKILSEQRKTDTSTSLTSGRSLRMKHRQNPRHRRTESGIQE